MAQPRNSSLRLRPRDGDGFTAIEDLDTLHARGVRARNDVSAALDLARDLGGVVPGPGSGATADLWEHLATLAAADVQAARVVEPHLDALAILAEATRDGVEIDLAPLGVDGPDSNIGTTWGVFAAESTDLRLVADERASGIRLTGTKPWCSLASRLSHALVTAHTASGGRALFAVDLRSPGLTTHDEAWVARGMTQVPSGPLDFDGVDAVRIGSDGWYLERRGFWWGALGVAAIWWGGAVGIARVMRSTASDPTAREPDQIAFLHLGAVDARLEATRAVLADAAARIDAAALSGAAAPRDFAAPNDSAARDARTSLHAEDQRLLAARGRAVAAGAAEAVLSRSARSLGPAPFALEAHFARQHADLALYVRQHHAERDDAALGRLVMASDEQGVATW